MLKNKNIIIGVTAGIAAYKTPLLVRLLIKDGANVKVMMTKDATQFVTPQTLSVLSKNEVIVDFFDANHNWNNHVRYAEWADAIVIAPLTANSLAKMANGGCDNVVLATYLSAKCPVFVAPAMDLEMYEHPSTKQNLEHLKGFGNIVIPAQSGELASGLVGEGRMAEPEDILAQLESYFKNNLPLASKTVLVNAGPTYEPIDPVRFIGNRSSGKMGIAIADYFASQGANVVLVLGPTHLKPLEKGVNTILVNDANEMYENSIEQSKQADIIICAAAVADYKAKDVSTSKIKKQNNKLFLELEKTKDILMELGKLKTKKQCLVGFALETENVEEYAKQKLTQKNCDIIIANSAKNAYGVVFGSDSNQITIIDKNNKITKFELLSKHEVAKQIGRYIFNYCNANA